jgi:uroporphyrinogen decarboxylase
MATQWGTKIHWTNNDESSPVIEVLVKKSEDWNKLWVLDPRKELREFLRTVEILVRDLYGMPFIYTIPSPLSQAMNSISTPKQVYKDMKENPDALKQGLDIITETTKDFARECIAEGATGIFFGIGNVGRSWRDLTQKQLEEYALLLR